MSCINPLDLSKLRGESFTVPGSPYKTGTIWVIPTDKAETPVTTAIDDNWFIKGIDDIFKNSLEIVRAKNLDYANRQDPFMNFKNSLVHKVPVHKGILVRLQDKLTRLSNILDREDLMVNVKDESIENTVRDAINYLAILEMWVRTEMRKGFDKSCE